MRVCFVVGWMLSVICYFGVNSLLWLVSGISHAWVLVNEFNGRVLGGVWVVILSFIMMVFWPVNGLCLCVASFLPCVASYKAVDFSRINK